MSYKKLFKGVTHGLKRYGKLFVKRYVNKAKSSLMFESKNEPLFVNSIPKSGTYMLFNLINAWAHFKYYGEFFATRPSYTLKEVPTQKLLRRFDYIRKREIILGHLHYKDIYSEQMDRKRIKKCIIIRDPRDVVCSETAYYTKMAPWNALRNLYEKAFTDEERIGITIKGRDGKLLPVGERLLKYIGWLSDGNTLVVRYENLVSSDYSEREVEKIFDHIFGASDYRKSEFVNLACKSIINNRPHTFNLGLTESWRTRLSHANIDLFKENGQELLEIMGYEKDDLWQGEKRNAK